MGKTSIEWCDHSINPFRARNLVLRQATGADPFEIVPHPEYDWEPRSLKLRHPKGGDWNEWPADLRVREFPKVGA